MFHRIREVTPMENMILEIRFVNDEVRIYDVKPLIKNGKYLSN